MQRYLEQQRQAKQQRVAAPAKKTKAVKGLKTARAGAMCSVIPEFLDQVFVNGIQDFNVKPIGEDVKVRVLGYETTSGGLEVVKVKIAQEDITENGTVLYFLRKDVR
ncbi:hypothetical protein D3C87_1682480 [compost metagenome]